jgi:hypothetical protein
MLEEMAQGINNGKSCGVSKLVGTSNLFSFFAIRFAAFGMNNFQRRRCAGGPQNIEFGLMFQNEQQIVSIRNFMIPNKTTRLALLHANADNVEIIRQTDRA